MTEKTTTTLTGVAVTVVALSRFIATKNPSLGSFLQSSLEGAVQAGLKPEDLALLRTVIESVTLR